MKRVKEREEIKNFREKIRQAGFVRIDGLRLTPLLGEPRVQERYPEPLNHPIWDGNNGVLAIAFPNGEIWIAVSTLRSKTIIAFMKERGWEGRGMYVPCSNQDVPSVYDVLRRIGDPDYIPKYIFNEKVNWRP